MSSTKCRACGLTNFSSAVVCRQCHYPLFGGGPEAGYVPANRRRTSRRWILNAALTSLVLAVILFFALYFFTLIYAYQDTAMRQTGWMYFSPAEMRTMGRRYGFGLIIMLLVVWGFFYSRRDKYDL